MRAEDKPARLVLGLTPAIAAEAAAAAVRESVGLDDESTGSRLAEAAKQAVLDEAELIGEELRRRA